MEPIFDLERRVARDINRRQRFGIVGEPRSRAEQLAHIRQTTHHLHDYLGRADEAIVREYVAHAERFLSVHEAYAQSSRVQVDRAVLAEDAITTQSFIIAKYDNALELTAELTLAATLCEECPNPRASYAIHLASGRSDVDFTPYRPGVIRRALHAFGVPLPDRFDLGAGYDASVRLTLATQGGEPTTHHEHLWRKEREHGAHLLRSELIVDVAREGMREAAMQVYGRLRRGDDEGTALVYAGAGDASAHSS